MPTTLIVLAHPEPRSFNGAWARASAQAAAALGHDVLWSDLYAAGFDPVEGPAHYGRADGPFDPLKAQERATETGSIPGDLRDEIAKVEAADLVVFHFPIWWFAPPAILKGWLDRVFLHGRLHSIDARFDHGRFRGRRVLFCVSAGAQESECGPDGREGDLRLLLWPFAQTMRYLGFDVFEPVAIYGVHGFFEGAERQDLERRLASVLRGQQDLMASLSGRPLIAFNPDCDFDEKGRLRPDRPSFSPFIRHRTD